MLKKKEDKEKKRKEKLKKNSEVALSWIFIIYTPVKLQRIFLF